MNRWPASVLACLVVLMALPEAARAAPVRYFLVAERPGAEEVGDSFILPLATWEHIFQARYQLRHPYQRNLARIVSADIARGSGGVNRNLKSNSEHPWKWHVTGFEGFVDFSAEIYDASPTWLHFNIVRYMRETGGHIGFWNYQVVGELPDYQPFRPSTADLPALRAASTAAAPAPAGVAAGLAMLGGALLRRR